MALDRDKIGLKDLLKLLNTHRCVDADVKLDRLQRIGVEIDAAAFEHANPTKDYIVTREELTHNNLQKLVEMTLDITSRVAYSDCILQIFHHRQKDKTAIVAKVMLKNEQGAKESFGHDINDDKKDASYVQIIEMKTE
jgi:hypothetical protein